MATLTINLLGGFRAQRGGDAITHFRSEKVRALLAYLVVEADRSHSRVTLAALLWPDQSGAAGLANLSQTLTRLRGALGEPTPLRVSRHDVAWDAGKAEVDVATFTHLAGSGAVADLEAAVALYGGELLAGFGLAECEAFEEWLLLARERLQQLVLDTLDRLAEAYLAAGLYAEAAAAARRQLAFDPWCEGAYRQLMRALAAAGDRAAALAAFERCTQVLLADLGVEPDAVTTALAAQLRQTYTARAADRAPQPVLASLPAPLTPMLGREEELATLDQLLRRGARLVTLQGPGGVGKTRLALAAVRALHSDTSGTPWLSLAGLADSDPQSLADGLASTVLAVLGFPMSTQRPPRDALLDVLRDRSLLVVLDNCEHLPALGPIVAAWLAAAPGLRVLATSRERLGVYGEELLVLDGLPLPDERSGDPGRSPAVQLFLAGARRQVPDWGQDQPMLESVARLCRLLEGMPLGIELAVHWVGQYHPDEIWTAVRADLAFLRSREPHAPARHHSLQEVFDYSWHRLAEAEQRVLARLSIFAGGFDRAAALAVAEARTATLAALVDKSLLRRVGAGRYTMHELLRQFAAARLTDVGERAALEAQHSTYYLRLVSEREQRLTRNAPQAAAAEVRAELDNVRQAWVWAARHAQLDALAESAYALGQFYMLSGLLAEGTQALALAAGHVDALLSHLPGDEAAQRQGQQLLSLLLSFGAMGLNLQSAYDQALPLAQRAVELGEASGGAAGQTMGALVWGEVLTRRGQLRDAQPLFDEALRQMWRATDGQAPSGVLGEIEWRAEVWLGIVAMLQDNYAEAKRRIATGLDICRRQTALIGEVTCLHRLAAIALAVEDYRDARNVAEQALDLARTLGYRWGEGVAERRLGEALHMLGDTARAAGLLEAALATFREIGDRTYEAGTLASLGWLAASTGAEARGREQLEQALALARTVKAYEPMLEALVWLAMVAARMGDYAAATAYAEQAWPIAQALGSRLRQAQVLVARGQALAGAQHHADAASAYQQARTLYAAIGMRAPAIAS
jgi:predicted ATPase/DNA-binding SARP family transcriptional activator